MRSKDRQKREDAARIAAATRFVVTTFVGRAPEDLNVPIRHSLWARREFTSLEAARAYRAQLGVTDEYGRRACIYAITPEEYSIHVE